MDPLSITASTITLVSLACGIGTTLGKIFAGHERVPPLKKNIESELRRWREISMLVGDRFGHMRNEGFSTTPAQCIASTLKDALESVHALQREIFSLERLERLDNGKVVTYYETMGLQLKEKPIEKIIKDLERHYMSLSLFIAIDSGDKVERLAKPLQDALSNTTVTKKETTPIRSRPGSLRRTVDRQHDKLGKALQRSITATRKDNENSANQLRNASIDSRIARKPVPPKLEPKRSPWEINLMIIVATDRIKEPERRQATRRTVRSFDFPRCSHETLPRTIDSICAYLKCFRPSTETGADLKSIPIFQMLSDIQLIEMLVDLRDELVRRRTKTTRTTLSTDPDLSDERNKERRFLAELPKSTLFELIGESLTEYERRSKKKTMSMHGVMPRVRPSDPPETYSTPLVYHRKDGPQTQKRERGQSEIFSNTPSNHVKGKSTISGSSPASTPERTVMTIVEKLQSISQDNRADPYATGSLLDTFSRLPAHQIRRLVEVAHGELLRMESHDSMPVSPTSNAYEAPPSSRHGSDVSSMPALTPRGSDVSTATTTDRSSFIGSNCSTVTEATSRASSPSIPDPISPEKQTRVSMFLRPPQHNNVSRGSSISSSRSVHR